jgi:DNA-binding transcriptional LysR family regulator
VEQIGSETRAPRIAPSGTIRVSCTAAFRGLHVTRLVFAFQDRYPDIGIDIGLTDERIDPVGKARISRCAQSRSQTIP